MVISETYFQLLQMQHHYCRCFGPMCISLVENQSGLIEIQHWLKKNQIVENNDRYKELAKHDDFSTADSFSPNNSAWARLEGNRPGSFVRDVCATGTHFTTFCGSAFRNTVTAVQQQNRSSSEAFQQQFGSNERQRSSSQQLSSSLT